MATQEQVTSWRVHRPLWMVVRILEKLPDAEVVQAFARIRSRQQRPSRTFLDHAVSDVKNAGQLRDALRGLEQLDPSQVFTPKGRAQVARVLMNAAHFEATLATVAVHRFDDDALRFMNALFLDGRDEAVDVLLAVVERAARAKNDDLDWIQGYRKRAAKTPAMTGLLDYIGTLLSKKNARNPEGQLRGLLHLEREQKLRPLALRLPALERDGGEVNFTFEPTRAAWLTISVWVPGSASRKSQRFYQDHRTSNGTLELKRVKVPAELPTWLAATARTLRVSWNWKKARWSGTSGKVRDHWTEWLRGAARP